MQFTDIDGKEVEKPIDAPVVWRPSVYALIRSTEDPGSILMVRPRGSDQYELPGGGIGVAEPAIESLIRECKEETGCTVVPVDKRPFHTGEMFFAAQNGEFWHTLVCVYTMELTDGEAPKVFAPEDPEEIEFCGWRHISELDENNVRGLAYPVIKMLKEMSYDDLYAL